MAAKRRTRSTGAKTTRVSAVPQKQTRAELRSLLAHNRSLTALDLMRSRKLSLHTAAREAGTTPRTMHRYVEPALKRGKDGRFEATKTDRLPRTVHVPTDEGTIQMTIRSSKTVSRIASYLAAVKHFLRTGDTRVLRPFRGQSYRTGKVAFPFITNPRTLERLASVGELSFEDFYALTTGESK